MRKLGILLILLLAAAAHAQDDGPPLIIYENSNLYTWPNIDQPPVPLDDCEPPSQTGTLSFSLDPSVGPSGRYMVLSGVPPVLVDAFERVGGFGGGAFPNDLYLCERFNDGTWALAPLALQPDDASLFTDGQPDVFISRGRPVWEPAGRRIAWTELRADANGMQDWLVIYDVFSGSITRQFALTNLPQLVGIPSPRSFDWSREGFVFWGAVFTGGDPQFTFEVQLTDEIGTLLSSYRPVVNPGESPMAQFLIDDRGADKVALLYREDGWFLLDPTNGDFTALTNATPELYNPAAPNGETLRTMLNGRISPVDWIVFDGGQVLLDPGATPIGYGADFFDPFARRFAPSPTGEAIAFFVAAQFSVSIDGAYASLPTALRLDNDNADVALFWGDKAWRVAYGEATDDVVAEGSQPTDAVAQPAPTAVPQSGAVTCPGFMASRLVPGEQGTLPAEPNSIPNRIRSDPSLSGTFLGQIAPGDVFDVLDGPVCADDFAWFQVNYGGLIGWTVEGQGDEYWLAPR